MKNKLEIKAFVLMILISVVFIRCSNSEDTENIFVTVNVSTAGTLSSQIDSTQKYKITKLTISGVLNGTDIKYIRDILFNGSDDSRVRCSLSELDLSEAKIVSGGEAYYTNNIGEYFSTDNELGSYAFYHKDGLRSIRMPKEITKIRSNAFNGCSNLQFIEMQDGVLEIDYGVFSNCNKLVSISIPQSVRSIHYTAFSSTSNLEQIEVEEENANYRSIDGILYNKMQTSICVYPSGKKGTNYSIPEGVSNVGFFVFSRNKYLTIIGFPQSLQSIESGCFASCESLSSISVDENNVNFCSIDGVLYNKAKSMVLSYPICRRATQYSMLNGIIAIDDYAFWGSKMLITLDIPKSVERIGYGSFLRCTGLIKIVLPSNVNSINATSFSECVNLKEIHCASQNPPVAGNYPTNFQIPQTCKLYVPSGSQSAYMAIPFWNSFKTIIEE
jgi:hypothetical protein